MLSSDRLSKACEGKSASLGGMNIGELVQLAKSRGYKGSSRRSDVLAFLCVSVKESQPSQQNTGLNDMPVELIEQILPTLGYNDLVSLGRTNRKLREIIRPILDKIEVELLRYFIQNPDSMYRYNAVLPKSVLLGFIDHIDSGSLFTEDSRGASNRLLNEVHRLYPDLDGVVNHDFWGDDQYWFDMEIPMIELKRFLPQLYSKLMKLKDEEEEKFLLRLSWEFDGEEQSAIQEILF